MMAQVQVDKQFIIDLHLFAQQVSVRNKNTTTTTGTIVLQPLYTTTCVSQYPYKKWMILTQQHITTRLLLLMATNTFKLRKMWKKCQYYRHHLLTPK